jgi:hypothetical protein
VQARLIIQNQKKGTNMQTGTTKTSEETTKAPTMYKEIEQEENVARGHVEVIEIIAYKATKEPRRYPPEKHGLKGEIIKKDGATLYVEVSSGPFFCQDPEDEQFFTENNPDLRTESFTVQVRKTTAIKYIDAPANMKQFERKV